MSTTTDTFMHRLWNQGQQHLAAGRYVAARTDLEGAEAIAWRDRDAAALARIYLPLLEVRRLIRYSAAEGTLIICPPDCTPAAQHQLLADLLRSTAGTVLFNGTAHVSRTAAHSIPEAACKLAGSVNYAARRTGHYFEALLLIQHGPQTRLASAADPTFAGGLPIAWTDNPRTGLRESIAPDLTIPLPPPGRYSADAQVTTTKALHAMMRESLIIAWEALALRWQHRHPPPKASKSKRAHSTMDAAWDEMAWLRLALRVDPACEPVSMRLMALAEAVERGPSR